MIERWAVEKADLTRIDLLARNMANSGHIYQIYVLKLTPVVCLLGEICLWPALKRGLFKVNAAA